MIDLPVNLAVDLIVDWLTLKDLTLLDMAQCDRSSRAGYLEALRSAGCVLHLPMLPPKYNVVPLMHWIEVRRIKISGIDLCNNTFNQDVGLLLSFFECVGPTLVDLTADNFGNSLLFICCLAMNFCTRLKVLSLFGCVESMASTVCQLIEQRSGTLERLALKNGDIEGTLPECCNMCKLQYLHLLKPSVACTGFVCRCQNLLYFYGHGFVDAEPCLHALAQSCPSLRSLHYGYKAGYLFRSTAGLMAVLLACKDMHTVDFTSSIGFTNAHVTTVVQHCRKLNALHLMVYEDGITEECVTILAPRLSELEHLGLFRMQCTTDAPLALLSQHCGNLKCLELRNLWGDVSDNVLVKLFKALKFLEAVDMSYVDNLSDVVLEAVGNKCHKLTRLGLFGTNGYTHKGITAIAQGCADLEWLSFQPNEDEGGNGRHSIFTELAQSV
jgi:hypothetical protein